MEKQNVYKQMRNLTNTTGRRMAVTALAFSLIANITAPRLTAQENLNFNAGSATVEGAISLSWNSQPNEYLRD